LQKFLFELHVKYIVDIVLVQIAKQTLIDEDS